MTEASAPLLAALAGRSRWTIVVAKAGERVVAGGALFVHDRAGWCDWAGTDPDRWKRGAQGAIAAWETGEAAPGGLQHSYRNIERLGFRALEVRENWIPTP